MHVEISGLFQAIAIFRDTLAKSDGSDGSAVQSNEMLMWH